MAALITIVIFLSLAAISYRTALRGITAPAAVFIVAFGGGGMLWQIEHPSNWVGWILPVTATGVAVAWVKGRKLSRQLKQLLDDRIHDRGWGVLANNPWNLIGMFDTRDEAEAVAHSAGAAKLVHYGIFGSAVLFPVRKIPTHEYSHPFSEDGVSDVPSLITSILATLISFAAIASNAIYLSRVYDQISPIHARFPDAR